MLSAPGGTGTSAVTFPWKASSTMLLELIGLLGAEPLVGVMGKLLGLEADASMELHFEPLTGIRLDPLAVDSLILFLRPGVF